MVSVIALPSSAGPDTICSPGIVVSRDGIVLTTAGTVLPVFERLKEFRMWEGVMPPMVIHRDGPVFSVYNPGDRRGEPLFAIDAEIDERLGIAALDVRHSSGRIPCIEDVAEIAPASAWAAESYRLVWKRWAADGLVLHSHARNAIRMMTDDTDVLTLAVASRARALGAAVIHPTSNHLIGVCTKQIVSEGKSRLVVSPAIEAEPLVKTLQSRRQQSAA